jgi:hypothetical protein
MTNVHPTLQAALQSFAPPPAPVPFDQSSADIIRRAQQNNQTKQVAA